MSSKLRRDIPASLAEKVNRIIAATEAYDIHTHLYDPAFGRLLLWGIDDLLVYHYLVAEAFRYLDLPYEKFWAMTKTQQADLIWEFLFIRHSPVSEACRGVLTTLRRLELDVRKRDLPALRSWFKDWNGIDYTTHCLNLAKVQRICMTNSPFDEFERSIWEEGFERDARFEAALRIDPLLLAWPETARSLAQWGYLDNDALSQKNIDGIRRFLGDWTRRIKARYLMVSLPPDFVFPDQSACAQLIERAVLPHCREFGVPFALMMGVRRAVNPRLKLAGDGVGRSDLRALEAMCATYPGNKFLVTVLSRENQHDLCVAARKFRNLHIFGCWWFTNVPSIIDEMTRMRLELLGLSVTPQHSDARVLDQIIYKWDHSREIIAQVLKEKYAELLAKGWEVTGAEMERDARDLLGGAFNEFCQSC